ncbi:unnamed protein product, partial [Eruca vesicaria subsp. sativa]|nr:unnamed protein product [Eruca vesicaria subsp. sativa]
SVDEDLRTAQMRKIPLLIDKARIEKNHEVLEIGCGWGTLAVEVVRRTGCKYTGITLSIKHLKYAEEKVKETGLKKFISIPEECYNEYRRSSDFIKEYIFPGGCLPSLTRVTSAMASSSRLCTENVENIGIHYYQTLRCWRPSWRDRSKLNAKYISSVLRFDNHMFAHMSNYYLRRQTNDLGFEDEFIRTWEYYFDYCAAGFKTLTLGNYQVVFSRPGNVAALGDPFRSFPSAQV